MTVSLAGSGDGVSAPVAGQRFWFLGTASLLSMAVDGAIATAVLEEIDDDTVVVIDVVVSELEHRATLACTAPLALRPRSGRGHRTGSS